MDTLGVDDQMGGAGPPDNRPSPPPAEEATANEGPSSIFLSQDSLGGKTVKAGDTLTFTVKSVDPETGDVEATIEGGAESGEDGYEAAFDKAMPPDEGEGY